MREIETGADARSREDAGDKHCGNCAWFARSHGLTGSCRNALNAKVEWVGGGGEYSSSKRCLIPLDTAHNDVCDMHTMGTVETNHRQAFKVRQFKTPEQAVWESPKWERVE